MDVDSFYIGDEDNEDLQTISYLSGGYIFKPESFEQAMAICEMEPVLSLLERPEIRIPRQSFSHGYDSYLFVLLMIQKSSTIVDVGDSHLLDTVPIS